MPRAPRSFSKSWSPPPHTAATDSAGAPVTSDPSILAWSHVYLGRLHDFADERDQAVSEYEAALAVDGAPEAARAAATRGVSAPYAPPSKLRRESAEAISPPAPNRFRVSKTKETEMNHPSHSQNVRAVRDLFWPSHFLLHPVCSRSIRRLLLPPSSRPSAQGADQSAATRRPAPQSRPGGRSRLQNLLRIETGRKRPANRPRHRFRPEISEQQIRRRRLFADDQRRVQKAEFRQNVCRRGQGHWP